MLQSRAIALVSLCACSKSIFHAFRWHIAEVSTSNNPISYSTLLFTPPTSDARRDDAHAFNLDYKKLCEVRNNNNDDKKEKKIASLIFPNGKTPCDMNLDQIETPSCCL
jgi:hypothetical protein